MNLDDTSNLMLLGTFGFSIIVAILLNQVIGFLFSLMIAFYGLASLLKKNNVIPIIEKRAAKFEAKAFGIFIAAIFGFFIIGSFLIAQPFNYFSVLKLYGTTALTKLSIQNSFLQFLIWGIDIPIAETLMLIGVFGALFFNYIVKNDYSIAKKLFISIVVGSLAVIAHVASQGFVDATLILDFVMFGMSTYIALVNVSFPGTRQLGSLIIPIAIHAFLNTAKLILGGA